jgi:hypothetical protein
MAVLSWLGDNLELSRHLEACQLFIWGETLKGLVLPELLTQSFIDDPSIRKAFSLPFLMPES